jgi:hypothetical protein
MAAVWRGAELTCQSIAVLNLKPQNRPGRDIPPKTWPGSCQSSLQGPVQAVLPEDFDRQALVAWQPVEELMESAFALAACALGRFQRCDDSTWRSRRVDANA